MSAGDLIPMTPELAELLHASGQMPTSHFVEFQSEHEAKQAAYAARRAEWRVINNLPNQRLSHKER